MEIGGTGSHAPWNMPTEPKFDTELIEIYARYVKLHHAPIWQIGSRDRQVLIPEGVWNLYWDQSQSWTGPATITIPATLDTLPLFIREGATVIH